MTMTRKQFLQLLSLGGLTSAAFATGCGDDETGTSGAAATTTTGSGGAGGMSLSSSSDSSSSSSSSSSTGGTGAGGDATGGAPATGGTGGSMPSACSGDVTAMISSDPKHMLMIELADVLAAKPKQYSIQGDSPHDHTVALTATDFQNLNKGQKVVKSSQGGGHTHQVTLQCA